MSEAKNFLGLPITGEEPQHGYKAHVEQGTAEEFWALLEPILHAEGVASVRWKQYTPYFNDGDVCEFSTGEFVIVTVRDDPDSDEWGDNDCNYEGSLHLRGRRFDPEAPTTRYDYATRTYVPSVGDYVDCEPTFPELVELQKTLRVGYRFDNVLKQAFGDHVTVTATREGFELDTYEHD